MGGRCPCLPGKKGKRDYRPSLRGGTSLSKSEALETNQKKRGTTNHRRMGIGGEKGASDFIRRSSGHSWSTYQKVGEVRRFSTQKEGGHVTVLPEEKERKEPLKGCESASLLTKGRGEGRKRESSGARAYKGREEVQMRRRYFLEE